MGTFLVFVVLAILAIIFCITQFVELMSLSDDAFPGRFDKPIWAAAILLTNVAGAVAFYLWKPVEAPRSGPSLRAAHGGARGADDPAHAE